MTLDELPPLREVASAHGLTANKAFGQHYLFDLNLTAKIARIAGPLENAAVIEVGPGPGGLTRALLSEGAAKVIAIETDDRFLPALEQISAAANGRLTVVHADALKVDQHALARDFGAGLTPMIVSNLPYNVGTPLLVRWLSGPQWWSCMTLMFQKEVAERIVARTGDDSYGRLSVLAALRSAPHLALRAPARAFTPPPKVDSAVVRFDPLKSGRLDDVEALETVTAAAFGQRRKMLRSSLKALAATCDMTADAFCAAAGVDAQARPETLAPEKFAAMAGVWRSEIDSQSEN